VEKPIEQAAAKSTTKKILFYLITDTPDYMLDFSLENHLYYPKQVYFNSCSSSGQEPDKNRKINQPTCLQL
jgi:hypothetical protein